MWNVFNLYLRICLKYGVNMIKMGTQNDTHLSDIWPCKCVCSVASQIVISVEPQTATVRQGESVSFRCQAGRDAVESVEWRRTNNQPLQGQECTSWINLDTSIWTVVICLLFLFCIDNVKIGPGGSVLTISNARPGNHGQYRCTVHTAAGRSSATATLNVRCVFHQEWRWNIFPFNKKYKQIWFDPSISLIQIYSTWLICPNIFLFFVFYTS